MHFSAKKLFLVGFIVLLLVGIPATVYLVQQQQVTRSQAEKSTNLSFLPVSSSGNTLTKSVGQTIPLDIMIDPGVNLVSFVRLEIQYDPDKLTAASANAFQVNSAIFPSVLAGPVYTPGKMVISMSVGTDPSKAIQTKVRAGTLTLKALANTTTDIPTQVTFTTKTEVLSIGGTDQASENVLAGTSPAFITIASTISPTGPGTTIEPTADPTTAVPTTAVPTTAVPTTVVPTSTGGTSPVCTALTADTTGGAAPLTINFTANGTDPDDTVMKATFNFGDGQVSDVTTGGGIGTNSVNVPLAHTYSVAGTYQATAILTDSNNEVSSTTNCTQTIVATGGSSGGGGGVVIPTATPPIPASGSTEVIMGIGAAAAFFMIGGALLFFLL